MDLLHKLRIHHLSIFPRRPEHTFLIRARNALVKGLLASLRPWVVAHLYRP